MPRGPKSKIEVDGKGLLIYQDRQAGMTLQALSERYGYPIDTISRFLRKTDRNSSETVELQKIDTSSPGLADAVRIDKALATRETMARLDEAYRHYRAAVDSGDQAAALRWHRELSRITDMINKSAGTYAPEAQVAVQVNLVNERREGLRKLLED